MGEHKNKKGKIVVVSGPSGAGKTTICREVVKRLSNAYLSVSVTTRERSEGEVDGQDVEFLALESVLLLGVEKDGPFHGLDEFVDAFAGGEKKVGEVFVEEFLAVESGEAPDGGVDVQDGELVEIENEKSVVRFAEKGVADLGLLGRVHIGAFYHSKSSILSKSVYPFPW